VATKAICKIELPGDLKPKRKVKVAVAAKLVGVSEATFRRHHSHLILKVGPRCDVVDVAAALAIGSKEDAA
jgi:hypothetical protein